MQSVLFGEGVVEAYCTMPRSSLSGATIYLARYSGDTPNLRTLTRLLTTAFRDQDCPTQRVNVIDCVSFSEAFHLMLKVSWISH